MGPVPRPIFRYLQVHPRTMDESIALSNMLVEEIQSIKEMLDDESRRQNLSPVEYMTWERRAKRAKWIKEQQQGELRAWRASRAVNLPPRDASAKREERQQAHVERIAAATAQAQVSNPLDTVELLRLCRSVFINCIDDGIEFSDDEQALMAVVREHLYMADGRPSALDRIKED